MKINFHQINFTPTLPFLISKPPGDPYSDRPKGPLTVCLPVRVILYFLIVCMDASVCVSQSKISVGNSHITVCHLSCVYINLSFQAWYRLHAVDDFKHSLCLTNGCSLRRAKNSALLFCSQKGASIITYFKVTMKS